MDASFLDSFVSKMSSFFKSQRKAYIKILTTMSKKDFDDGKYVLSFDAITAQDESMITSVRTKRQQEVHTYKELGCISASLSGEFEVPLKDKKCAISFSVTGALQPFSPLEKGEDILEYSLTQSESRKILHLTPTFDTSGDSQALIKFRIGEDVKHTVVIHNVPVTRLSESGSSASRLSASGSSASGFNDSLTEPKNVDSCDGGTMRQSDRYTSEVEESVKNLAIGEPPRTKGPTYEPPSLNAASFESCASDEYEDTEAYGKILTNASLRNLVYAIPPQDAWQLFIHLGIPDSVIKTKKGDHPGDISSAHYDCLVHWIHEMRKSQPGENMDKKLFSILVRTLEIIQRNDLASTLQTVVSLNRELHKSDFKNI